MYFYYGITHSTLENPDEEIELKVDQNLSPPAQNEEQTAVWDRHGYENRMAEDGNSWNGGGCWNAAAPTTTAGWGDRPSITVSNNNTHSTNGSYNNSAKKPSSSTKGSGSTSKSKTKSQPPAPAAKKPAASTASAAAPSSTTQAAATAPKKDGFGMFVQEAQFPSWDD